MSDKSREPTPTPRESTPKPETESEPQPEPEASTSTPTEASPESDTPPHAWQAIFSPQHNAYYFYNSTTQETTWVNPLQGPEAASSSSAPSTLTSTSTTTPTPTKSRSPSPTPATPASTSHYAALQAAAAAQGIDPALAYLDPSLLASTGPNATASTGPVPLFTAKFNRHTGAFSRPDARDPSHLSESERAKRMSEVYFDVKQWEEDLAKQGGSIKGPNSGEGDDGWEDDGYGGKKRKRPTKKDLERFKEQKKQKKLAKTAWLRN